MVKNAGVSAFIFKGKTCMLSYAELKVDIAEKRLDSE